VPAADEEAVPTAAIAGRRDGRPAAHDHLAVGDARERVRAREGADGQDLVEQQRVIGAEDVQKRLHGVAARCERGRGPCHPRPSGGVDHDGPRLVESGRADLTHERWHPAARGEARHEHVVIVDGRIGADLARHLADHDQVAVRVDGRATRHHAELATRLDHPRRWREQVGREAGREQRPRPGRAGHGVARAAHQHHVAIGQAHQVDGVLEAGAAELEVAVGDAGGRHAQHEDVAVPRVHGRRDGASGVAGDERRAVGGHHDRDRGVGLRGDHRLFPEGGARRAVEREGEGVAAVRRRLDRADGHHHAVRAHRQVGDAVLADVADRHPPALAAIGLEQDDESVGPALVGVRADVAVREPAVGHDAVRARGDGEHLVLEAHRREDLVPDRDARRQVDRRSGHAARRQDERQTERQRGPKERPHAQYVRLVAKASPSSSAVAE
jgi:hypothetical protein